MVSDIKHGAIIQVKYNPQLDPGSQYSATMDTKDVAITPEQLEYIVIQKYPEGATKTVRSEGGVPAQFEYVRCVNSRDDMTKGLRRNGYYGVSETSASAAHTFDEGKSLTREETIARADQETPIETIDLEISNIFPIGDPMPLVDEEPAPKKGTAVAKAKTAVKSTEPCDECPTEFGRFANHMVCFTECGVSEECKKESNSRLSTSKTAETPKKKPTSPQVEAATTDDDDDTV